MPAAPSRLGLDHLVLGVPDLRQGVLEFEESTGLQPVYGGQHATGTANHLVSLGGGAYLEILGLLPEARGNGQVQPFGIEHVSGPRLLTWCVRSRDIERDARAAADHGLDVGEVLALSRVSPASERLVWRMTRRDPMAFDGVAPFLIDWGATRHPSERQELPRAELLSLGASHPRASELANVLDALGIHDVSVTAGSPGMRAEIRTPKGVVELQ